MKFLLPNGGEISDTFGILTSPGHKGIAKGLKDGLPWGADNQAFTQGFDPVLFFSWLKTVAPFRDTCIFVAVPDIVGHARETLESFHRWSSDDRFKGWPLAYVAQDGAEKLPIPEKASCLFIGGTDDFKTSAESISCIKRAQRMGMHIHVGRVNWGKRYRFFNVMTGSGSFTCDGTRPRYDGIEKTKKAWAGYMSQPPLLTV